MDSKAFYDDWVDRQTAVGVNERHRAILAWLQRFGLREDHRVLEVGCGVGTVTALLAETLSERGSVLGVDLSPRSVDAARARLAGRDNVRLEAADVLEMDLSERFDVVVLPDVIEHIPLEHHGRLFARLASWTRPDGFVLLHYPNPLYLDWCREHRPELLQPVDQAIHPHHVATRAHEHGLHLVHLETYSIWVEEGDYVVALLRPARADVAFHDLPGPTPSLLDRIRGRLRRLRG
jgi:cyclopropane fatty-acyl-phospholipid synthase-like methyltransferase